MSPIIAAVIVAAAVLWAARQIVVELRAAHVENARARAVALMQLFAPVLDGAERDPRTLLVWQPLAAAARKIFPVEFSTLDRAAGGTFPFSKTQIEAAHARWTSEWLAWERTHDAEYKLKASAAEQELKSDGGNNPQARARLEFIEREKLDLYQQRYQEYVRVAKALQALATS